MRTSRTSSIWTATYETPFSPKYNGCWSHTWGSENGPQISAKTAVNLAVKFLEAHKSQEVGVPALIRIKYLYPCKHEDLTREYWKGEADYHLRTL